MMKPIAFAIFLIQLCLSASACAQSIPLIDAVQQGKVSLKAQAPSSYSQVSMVLKNRTNQDLIVDAFGICFVADDGPFQRLGVARASMAGAETALAIKAGQDLEVTVPSFCLDGARASPPHNAAYSLAQQPVPKSTQLLFGYWNKNLEIGKGLIQGAIWSGDHKKLEVLIEALQKDFEKCVKPNLIVVAGHDYLLTKTGELFAVNPKGKSSEHAKLIDRVLRIFKCNDRLIAVRLDGGIRLIATKFENKTWSTVDELPFVPSHALCLQSDQYLFAEKEWLYLPNRRMLRFKGNLVRLEASDSDSGIEYWALSADQRLFKLNPETGLPASFDRPYDDVAAGQGIRLYRKGQIVELADGNINVATFRSTVSYDLIQAEGRYAALVGNHELWTLQNEKLEKVATLEDSLIAMDIDISDGSAHLLQSNGEIKVFRLPAIPRHQAKVRLPEDSKPTDFGFGE